MITGPHVATAIVVCLLMWMCWWLGIDHEQSRRGGTRELRRQRAVLDELLADALARIEQLTPIQPSHLPRPTNHGGIDQTRLHLVAGDRRPTITNY